MKRWLTEGRKPEGPEAETVINYLQQHPELVPFREDILDVEGIWLPKEMRVDIHSRWLWQVPVCDRWGLWGCWDVLVDEGTTRVAVDWKGHTREDFSIQAAVYFLAASSSKAVDYWGPFERFVFSARSIPEGWREDYEFLMADRPTVVASVSTMVERVLEAERTNTFEPRLNRWCSTCPIQADCAVYATTVTCPAPVETLLEAKEWPLPTEFVDLIALRDRLRAAEAIVEVLQGRVDTDLRCRLKDGPVHQDGKEWRLQERTTRYDLDETAALALAGDLGIHSDAIKAVDWKRLESAVHLALALPTVMDKKNQIRRLDACRIPRSKAQIIVCRQAKG